MKAEMELMNLLIANPELRILQEKIQKDMANMDQEQRCIYLQELMLDNLEEIKQKLTSVVEMING